MRTTPLLCLLALLSGCALVRAQEKATGPCPYELQQAAEDAGSHALLDSLLRSFVHDGVVDYRCLKEHEAQLDRYLARLQATDPGTLERNEELAFWINAYNAFTLKLILNTYPELDSILELSSPWSSEVWPVQGEKYSLSHIENEILRHRDEARIHFAIVCASFSCPDLISEAWVAGRLEQQLADATRAFLADEEKGAKLVSENGAHTLYLSKLFEWYAVDFADGDVLRYVKEHAPPELQARLRRLGEVDIAFLEYDWTLNGR